MSSSGGEKKIFAKADGVTKEAVRELRKQRLAAPKPSFIATAAKAGAVGAFFAGLWGVWAWNEKRKTKTFYKDLNEKRAQDSAAREKKEADAMKMFTAHKFWTECFWNRFSKIEMRTDYEGEESKQKLADWLNAQKNGTEEEKRVLHDAIKDDYERIDEAALCMVMKGQFVEPKNPHLRDYMTQRVSQMYHMLQNEPDEFRTYMEKVKATTKASLEADKAQAQA